MVDKRFIAQTDVLSGLESRPNLLELTLVSSKRWYRISLVKWGWIRS